MDDPIPNPTPSPAARVNTAVERAIQRHGSAENALSVLMAQAVTLEDQATTDRQTIADLRGKVPDPEKMVVLPKERAELLNKYEALKLTPEQITASITKTTELQGTLSDRDREALARQAAGLAGFDPNALVDHTKAKGLHIEIRDATVKEHGKDVTKKIPHVRPAADDKAPLVALSEYATKLPAHEQRMLQAPATTTTTQGPTWPVQTPTPVGGGGGSDKVAAFLTQRNQKAEARPNPFAPPRQPAAAAS